MIKSLLSKLTHGILILALVYAGSFTYIEEGAEQTEKTEKFEEAIHDTHRAKNLKRSLAQTKQGKNYPKLASLENSALCSDHQEVLIDFNVNYIYTTSYLDSTI